MKIMKALAVTFLLSTMVYCQQDPSEQSYNSTGGINLSVFLPLRYSIGYDFVLSSNSTLRPSVYYRTNNINDSRKILFAHLSGGEYNEWADSYNNYRIGMSLYCLYDIYKYPESKFYTGAGAGVDYGESDYEYSRELDLVNKNEHSSMTNYQNHKRISFDLLMGYEYTITNSIKIFSEAIYYFLWDKTEETITDGWDMQFRDLGDIENTGLSHTQDGIVNSLTASNGLNFRIGVILSL